MAGWTKWYDLEPSEFGLSHDLDDFGIYRIRIVDSDRKPLPLDRLLKRDDSGLVYIGRSGIRPEGSRTIRNRLREWRKRRHSGAKTYARAKEQFSRTRFASHSLEVSALILPTQTIFNRESREIEAYINRFGEPPPFNSNKPKSED